LIAWLYLKADSFTSSWYTPVDLVGLYWHIVDMIWIYLFPLYYLIS
jgi:cytochrome c oxidase subunit 3